MTKTKDNESTAFTAEQRDERKKNYLSLCVFVSQLLLDSDHEKKESVLSEQSFYCHSKCSGKNKQVSYNSTSLT